MQIEIIHQMDIIKIENLNDKHTMHYIIQFLQYLSEIYIMTKKIDIATFNIFKAEKSDL